MTALVCPTCHHHPDAHPMTHTGPIRACTDCTRNTTTWHDACTTTYAEIVDHLQRAGQLPTTTETPTMTTITEVEVDLIDPHPHNPRRSTGDVTELAESISAQGIRQNLLVVPHPDEPGRFRAVIGHRRLEAAKVACLPTVPAAIDDNLSDAQQLELMLVENLQRVDLSPIEEAQGYQDMLELGVGVRQIARQTGRSEKTVTGRLKLLTATEAAREKLHSGQTTIEEVLELAKLPEDSQQKVVASLGTTNFAWAVGQEKQEIRWRKEAEEQLEKWRARGVTEAPPPPNGWTPPEGYTWWHGSLDDELPEGLVYHHRRQHIHLYRPLTLDEASAEEALEADRRQAREADEQEARDASTAHELRMKHVRGLIDRKLSAAEKTKILTTFLAPSRRLNYDGWQTPDPRQIRAWMGDDDADPFEYAQGLDPHKWMLLCMVRSHDGSAYGMRMLREGRDDTLRDLYELLVELGYQLSTVEAEAITAAYEDDDEDLGDG